MFIGGGLILLLVIALTACALLARTERRRWLKRQGFVIGAGIVFPVVALTALLTYGAILSRDLVAHAARPDLRIEVVGERWWWRVRYLDRNGETWFATANEIRVPVGKSVEYLLLSQDVNHSFWVPNLAGKLDMIPGVANRYRFAADRPGIFRGQCAEYCGAQHTFMAFFFVALAPDEFEAWASDQARPVSPPTTDVLRQGEALFLANGCGSCHQVRGTPASGQLGPDLTHVGSRLSIGAAMFPNNVGTLAGWIASTQHLKPDALMPSFGNLTGVELRAMAAYLESLK